ncbi:MAG: neutral/alkaline non-lysosomal ceramidase N-terminal domain-containing protein [Acidobacteriota bacterium]|nr:neutral/alkaline non-lysosomal ceramidase N-terminal domain-containing protein [Acidobacteriota bacterium]
MLSAGFSKVCISPPVGSPLAGFAARQDVSAGIHDDLYARALVLLNEQATVALVSVDVLALPNDFVRSVRAAIQNATGIGPGCVIVASTHTHSGPVTIRTFFNPDGSVDQSYMNRLADAITEAVATAWRNRFPARVGVGACHVEGVGVNRRNPDRQPVDREAGIIKVEDAEGRARAVFINYACHPTVLGPDNLLVTGDFPAFAVKEVEEALGQGGFAMFVNGTQGNISMGHSSELSAIGIITPGRTFERAAELGHLLAEATLNALPAIETTDAPALGAASMTVGLPAKKYPPAEETERALRGAEERLARVTAGGDGEQLNRAKSEHLYASIENFYAGEVRALADGLLPVELQGLRVGDAIFLAVPAEVFVEVGLRLKQVAPQKTFIVGIANGYIGYLPTREAHEVGGYEVVSSKCRPEAADVLIEKAVELEKQLFGSKEAQA